MKEWITRKMRRKLKNTVNTLEGLLINIKAMIRSKMLNKYGFNSLFYVINSPVSSTIT